MTCLADDLKEKLENWIATNPKIKLLRHKKREGLIRARMTGAEAVKGEVMVFLDSHCECNVGWLEPLLERVYRNHSTVVCPVIDVISWERVSYSTVRGPPGVRGGFNWGLQFKWKKIPDYEQQRRGYDETRWVGWGEGL
jgi:polypeptide N-acetylgalactosaminyltransferase